MMRAVLVPSDICLRSNWYRDQTLCCIASFNQPTFFGYFCITVVGAYSI